MQVSRGRFFTYIPISLIPRSLDFTFKGLFRDEEGAYLPPLRDFTAKAILLPHFCMADESISPYGEEFLYSRLQANIEFQSPKSLPVELRLLPHNKSINLMTPCKHTIPDSWLELMSAKAWQLQAVQGRYSFVLEQAARQPATKETEQPLASEVCWLSVKSLLDPEDGLERLLADVAVKKAAGFVPVKMARLLEIIRVAQPGEEATIMQNVYRDDQPLWRLFEKMLVTAELLPYMKKAEVFAILQKSTEQELQSLKGLPPAIRAGYRPFFSERRWENMSVGKVKPGPDLLWLRIIKHYRERYESRLIIDQEPAVFAQELEELEPGLIREGVQSGLLAEPAPWSSFSWADNQLTFFLETPLKEMVLYLETQKFTLRKNLLFSLRAGFYRLKTPAVRRIFIAGIDTKNDFKEGIVLNMEKFVS